MIIDFDKKFIFLRTRRTASSSIASYLYDRVSENSIISPDRHVYDESLRLGWNWQHGMPVAHSSIHTIRQNFPKEFESYYIFCVERNPYDYAYSEYMWRRNAHIRFPNDPLEGSREARYLGFPAWTEKRTYPRNYEMYSFRGNILVDKVVRYEHLYEDLKEVFSQLSIPFYTRSIPFEKAYTRGEKSLEEVYTEKRRMDVRMHFKDMPDAKDWIKW